MKCSTVCDLKENGECGLLKNVEMCPMYKPCKENPSVLDELKSGNYEVVYVTNFVSQVNTCIKINGKTVIIVETK